MKLGDSRCSGEHCREYRVGPICPDLRVRAEAGFGITKQASGPTFWAYSQMHLTQDKPAI